MPDTAKKSSVAAYHRHLSNHLNNLLRATGFQPGPRVESKNGGHSMTTSSASISKGSLVSHSENDPSTISSPDAVTPPQDVVPPPSKTTDAKTMESLFTEREIEHDAAWRQAGAVIYSTPPPMFNLVLDKPCRGSNTQDTSCPPPRGGKSGIRDATMEKGMKGLGIDLAISDSQDVAIKMGLMVDPLVPRPITPPTRQKGLKPVEIRRLVPKASVESFNLNCCTSVHSPNVASVSSFVQYPAPRRRSQESGKSRLAHGISATNAQNALRDPNQDEDDKVEEYELRRELRLKKRFAELEAKIHRWRDAVPKVAVAEVGSFPELMDESDSSFPKSNPLHLHPVWPVACCVFHLLSLDPPYYPVAPHLKTLHAVSELLMHCSVTCLWCNLNFRRRHLRTDQ